MDLFCNQGERSMTLKREGHVKVKINSNIKPLRELKYVQGKQTQSSQKYTYLTTAYRLE